MPNHKNIPYQELAKKVGKVAIKNKIQVEKGGPGENKRPWKSWEDYPKDYTHKINDPKYPTAFKCDYIKDLDLYFNVIDLDIPKQDDHIQLNTLKSMAIKIISNTYSTKTPSGGYHLYILSRKKPEAKQPKRLNIDYQANTGKGRGKYIIADYRWTKNGKRERYEKLTESPEHVAIVDNIDHVFNAFLEDLEHAGYIKTAQNDLKGEIINLLKPYVEEGGRQFFSCTLAGYLRKQGFEENATTDIIKGLFQEDEELHSRLENVKRTYNANIEDMKGYSDLKERLPPIVLNKLQSLTNSTGNNARAMIAKNLLKHKEPSVKLLADLVLTELDLYIDHKTLFYYEKLRTGGFKQIDYVRIIHYLNEQFGINQISENKARAVLSFVTNPIKKDYDILEFTNGFLNTKTMEFKTDKKILEVVPKISMPWEWNPEAQGGYIQQVFEEILDKENDQDNMLLWLRLVGHMFMGINSLARFMVVVGPSRSGKSTLSTALERIFNVSRIPTQKIVGNERFALIDLIDKDINIDDDIANGILQGIGFLNTVIAGHNLSVEKKGINEPVVLCNEQIPILIANGNSLPPVIGEGFDTRLALIKCPNVRKIGERDETLHSRILQGEYDPEMEWLVYTAIKTYKDNLEEVLINQKLEEEQNRGYQFQSDPLKVAIEALFIDDFMEEDYVPVKDVNKYLKIWSSWAYKNGKISKEHKRPSNTRINKAMDRAGYNQKNMYYYEDDTRTSMRVYENIKTTDLINLILGDNAK